MLAALGFVVQQFITLPGMTHVDDSNLAPEAAGISAMLQIVFGIGILEFWSNNGKVTMEDMFEDPARVPGEFGFDPMGLGKGKSKEEMEKLQLSEIKNGRLVSHLFGSVQLFVVHLKGPG